MSDVTTFTCEPRLRAGTGGSRAVRREGWVPAVIYGGDQDAANIKLRYNEILKAYNTGSLIGVLSKVDLEGEEIRVVGRDIQVDPIKDLPMHVDFLRVNRKTRINVEVPVNIIGEEECPGMRQGGVMNLVRHAVEVIAPALEIPESIDADISALEIGDSINISNVNLPDGVVPTITDRDFVIVTIASPKVAVEEEAEGEEVAADEVEATAQKDGEEEGA